MLSHHKTNNSKMVNNDWNGYAKQHTKNMLQFIDIRLALSTPCTIQANMLHMHHIQIRSQMDAKQLIVNQFYCCKA